MQAQDFTSLQQSFQSLVVAHASATPQAAAPAAAAAAQQWLAVIEQAAQGADAVAKRQMAGQLVLMLYYGLFDAQKWSPALAHLCPR